MRRSIAFVPGLVPSAAGARVDLGVIRDARRRQRRRRMVVVLAVAIAATAAFFGGRSLLTGGPDAVTVAPSVAFAQAPYMGVSCGRANVIACDRVGLAVYLRRPATVTASIDGRPLRLDDPHWSWVEHNGRATVHVYSGFLRAAGLMRRLGVVPDSRSQIWTGAGAPSPAVRFRIDYGHGNVVLTRASVPLSAGWG